MTMSSKYEMVDVNSVEYDTENPRIKEALEKYKDKITAERIHFALRSASDDSDATSSFSRLKDSIHSNGGVTQPIVVVVKEGKKICIDGNTRLTIYRDFLKKETTGSWDQIPALVMRDAELRDIEAVRVSAHLVGPRPWPAYEKARYLHDLYHSKLMEFEEMVALCGGNRFEIERQIEAYDDMNNYYRDQVDDNAFHIDRFSGFVELQRPKVKQAIFEAGFELKDFGEWIRDGNIRRLESVRHLPKVLEDEEAIKIFVKEGGMESIDRALKYLDQKADSAGAPMENSKLKDASIGMLAKILSERIYEIPFSTVHALQQEKTDDDAETVRTLEDLMDRLRELLQNVRK